MAYRNADKIDGRTRDRMLVIGNTLVYRGIGGSLAGIPMARILSTGEGYKTTFTVALSTAAQRSGTRHHSALGHATGYAERTMIRHGITDGAWTREVEETAYAAPAITTIP